MKSNAMQVVAKLYAEMAMFTMLRRIERECTLAATSGAPTLAGLERARQLVEAEYDKLSADHEAEQAKWEHEVREAQHQLSLSHLAG